MVLELCCFEWFQNGGVGSLNDYIVLEKEKDEQELKAIIAQELPHTANGDLILEPEEALEIHKGLAELSKKNKNQWKGRNSQNAVCVFDMKEGQKIGDLVSVFVHGNTQGTLLGETVL